MLRALGATWRVETRGVNPIEAIGEPQIGAFWHRDILATSWFFRDRGYGVAISRSRDGDLITAVVGRLGYRDPARGSSSRGGASALRGLVRMVEDGSTVSLPTDGPRGPALRSKVGAIALARLTGVGVTPIAFAARPALRFRSWDRTVLPLPFAKVHVVFGDLIEVPRKLDAEELESIRTQLERTLLDLHAEADELSGFRDSAPLQAAPV